MMMERPAKLHRWRDAAAAADTWGRTVRCLHRVKPAEGALMESTKCQCCLCEEFSGGLFEDLQKTTIRTARTATNSHTS